MAKGFLKGVRAELKKVVWPTRKQLINNTVLVVVLILAFAVIVFGFDFIIQLLDGKLWDFIESKIG